jgi:hypothetical protein
MLAVYASSPPSQDVLLGSLLRVFPRTHFHRQVNLSVPWRTPRCFLLSKKSVCSISIAPAARDRNRRRRQQISREETEHALRMDDGDCAAALTTFGDPRLAGELRSEDGNTTGLLRQVQNQARDKRRRSDHDEKRSPSNRRQVFGVRDEDVQNRRRLKGRLTPAARGYSPVRLLAVG